MTGQSLGSLNLASYTLSQLEDCVKASFEARRGSLYNALRGMNALSIFEIGRGGVGPKYSDRDVKKLVWQALKQQMEEELEQQFRFLYCHRMAMRKYRDPTGVVLKLEKLVPDFAEEFRQREAQGKLGRKGGIIRWSIGIQEVGSIEDLLAFTKESLFFASYAFDYDSRYPDLERRIGALQDSLPD